MITITRTAWTDDDGSGTTGTVINNAVKTELYNQIDAALAQVVPLLGGAPLRINIGTDENLYLRAGTTYDAASGVTLVSRDDADTVFKQFELRCSKLLVNVGASSGIQFVNFGAATWASGDKYLVIDSSGNIHVSAVGPSS